VTRVVEEGTAVPEVSCLVSPPPQLLASTVELAGVAARLEDDDVAGARAVLYSIDLAACERYWSECGHAATAHHDPAAHSVRGGKRKPFRVSAKTYRMLGDRDGWRCRYCSIPVVHAKFLKIVRDALPTADFPPAPLPMTGTAYPVRRVFKMTPDHVVPRSAGGFDEVSNLVSSCGACNFAKSSCTLDELGLSDPCAREPILDGWNGLQGRGRSSVKHRGPVTP
jgi:hypothetical protein